MFRQSHIEFREKLRKSRLRQNDGFLIKKLSLRALYKNIQIFRASIHIFYPKTFWTSNDAFLTISRFHYQSFFIPSYQKCFSVNVLRMHTLLESERGPCIPEKMINLRKRQKLKRSNFKYIYIRKLS